MGSEPAAHGRLLWEADGGGRRYISYDALRGDAVPCSRPGVPYYNCRKCLAQMVLLAVPRVVMSTFLLGILVKFTFPYDWNWKTSFLFSGLLSATDPVTTLRP
ncbi:sodium/hydrogen exchanger 8-like isoform X2 [Hordeum vulgare subsp. vulgare]|uniref:sodium/hydrogen exchanger 8-like isoform X2 n=1 Tax=Hordeum vulgare subsp. vulgare TaxID=112509 RepID=UPI000B462762|nr:sodium/hydrogen exchanger 8-like isoform X2 [Hordeum vulgare subsp. vulgare]KAI4987246.1 hypothetical protein ZWY2020_020046 [Hordeum vulgare]